MDKIINKIRAGWRKIPKSIRSGWITAWITFTSTLFTIAVGLLPTLATAISTKDFGPFFESLSVGWSAALAAATGFFAGLVNTIYRVLKPIAESYQTASPPEG